MNISSNQYIQNQPESNPNFFKGILLIVFLILGSLSLSAQQADFTMEYDAANDEYVVSTTSTETGNTFAGMYIGLVVEASTSDNFTITSSSSFGMGRGSFIGTPNVDSANDYHHITGSGIAPLPATANTAFELFRFSLGDGSCSSGVRLFINSTDPDSAAFTAAGDTGLDFQNGFEIGAGTPIYDENFLAPITVCPASVASPGGISTNLTLWLKADAGATTTTWTDQSTSGNNATSTSVAIIPDNMNFNPSYNFDAAGVIMTLDTNIEALNSTMFVIGQRNNTTFSTILKGSNLTNDGDYQMLVQPSGAYGYWDSASSRAISGVSWGNNETHLASGTIPTTDNNPAYYSLDGANYSPTANVNTGPNDYKYIGNVDTAAFQFGYISEVLIYDTNSLTATQRQQIESYLAIKYGITLDQSASGGGTSYLASDGSTIWAEDINDNHEFHIFGIGRDDASGLGQVKSKSVNAEAVVTIEAESEGTNSVNAFTDIADKEFLMVGNDDDGTIGGENWYMGTGGTYDSYAMLERVWRSQQVGNVGTVQIDIDVADPDFDLAAPLDGGVYYFIQDTDGDTDFDDETPIAMTDQGGDIWRVTGVTFGSNDKFTFGTAIPSTEAPGGISADLALWLKADEGVTGTTNVTQWNDQSGNDYHMAQGDAARQPALLENTMNFNPVIKGDGTLDYLFRAETLDVQTVILVTKPLQEGALGCSSVFSERGGDDENIRLCNLDGELTWSVPGNFGDFTEAGGTGRLNGTSGTNPTHEGLPHVLVVEASAINSLTGGLELGTSYTSFGNRNFSGQIAEVISYGATLSLAEKNKIESYLAIKYGITLDQSAANGSGIGDYLASDGTVIFDAPLEAAGAFNHEITGIGRDDDQALNQKQSKSVSANGIVAMGLSTIEASNAANTAVLADKNFMVWANNDGAATWTSTGAPSDYELLGKQWQIQETGTVGAVTMQFDVADADFDVADLIAGTSYYLVYDVNDNNDLRDDTPVKLVNSSGDIWETSTAINFTTGMEFSLATADPPTPGGVSQNLTLWLKSDAGTLNAGTPVTGIGVVDQWQDQSTNENHALNLGANDISLIYGEPITGEAINFNPILRFNNTGDKFSGTNLGMDGDNTMTEFYALHDSGEGLQTEGREAFNYSENDRTAHRIEIKTDLGGFALMDDAFPSNLDLPRITTNALSPAIISASHSGTTITGYTRGTLDGSESVTTGISANGVYGIGNLEGTDEEYGFGEVIIYSETLSPTDRQKIDSYLAIKYGTPLNNGLTNYLSSDGTVVWPVDATYNQLIFGIARDDDQGLHQRISKAVGSSRPILTLSTDTDFEAMNSTHTSTLATDKQFLIVASNENSLPIPKQDTELDAASGFNLRIAREWKVANTGSVGVVNMKFDGYDDTWSLITTDGSGDFSSGITSSNALSAAGTIAITLGNNTTFTLAKYQLAPGSVTPDIVLWLKADAGTNSVVNGDPISQWDNQVSSAATEVTQATVGAQPLYIENSGFNFNPAIDFDGTDDELFNPLNDDALFPSYNADETNVFIVTAFDKGLTEANGPIFGLVNEDFSGYESWYADYPSNGAHTYQVGLPASGGTETTGTVPADIGVNTPSIAGFVHSIVDDKIQVLVNGSELSSTSAGATGLVSNGIVRIGTAEREGGLTQEFYDGKIVEVIAYDANLSDTNKLKIQSYLAIKYGITLDQTTPTDYLASDGSTPMWDASENTGFGNDIFGMGRDDDSVLGQVQSQSINSDAIITLFANAEGTNAANVFVDIADLEFLTISNDNDNDGTIEVVTAELDVTTYQDRLDREWKVDETGETGTAQLSVNLSGTFTALQSVFLLIDDDANFAANTGNAQAIAATSWDGTTATFDGVDLNDADYFTFAAGPEPTFPGGVATDLALWLKADEGGAAWTDQSSEGNLVIAQGDPSLNASGLNFNPSVTFDGTGDQYIVSDDIPMSGTDPFSIMMVMKPGTTANRILGATNNTIGRGFLFFQGGTMALHKNGTGNLIDGGTSIKDGASHITGIRRSGNTFNTFRDGFVEATETSAQSLTSYTNYVLGNDNNTAGEFEGEMAEVIIYSSDVSDTERLQIESYLALKYGITLRQDGGGGLDTQIVDYLASDGSLMWSTTKSHEQIDAGGGFFLDKYYAYNVTGIGRDDDSSLNQRVSKSVNSDAVLSIALDADFTTANNDAARTTSHTNDLQFISFGHDGFDSGTKESELDAATGFNTRLKREWKIQRANMAQDVTLKFEGRGGWALVKVVSGEDFSSNVITIGTLDADGEITITAADLPDATVFTVATYDALVQIGDEADSGDTINSVITVAQINTIEPAVTNAIVANETNYQDYIDANPANFSSPATQAEVQIMINAVNLLVAIGLEEDDTTTTTPGGPSAAALNAIPGVTNAVVGNQNAYQAYIDANDDNFSNPATVAEVQIMINAVNLLVGIGLDEDDTTITTPGGPSAAALNAIPGVTNAVAEQQNDYQTYIDANDGNFSNPATVAEVQIMINAVSLLTAIGLEEDDTTTTTPGGPSAAALNAIPGVTNAVAGNQNAYQAYIDANDDNFSNPATVAEVQTMINAVNATQTVLAEIGADADNGSSDVTIAELNSIEPSLTGVVSVNETAYQEYIAANADEFSAPATQAEVQAMITAVNTSVTVLAEIGADADAGSSDVTIAELNTIEPSLTGVVPANETAYQEYIAANADEFSAPATQAEVQAMITAVNTSVTVLAEIGTDADAGSSDVTIAELNSIEPSLTGVVPANETAYQEYIAANADEFSAPATQAEVQAMITAVNASVTVLAEIGSDADNGSSDVTIAELNSIEPSLTGVFAANETAYQEYIAANADEFSAPATQAEVQDMIDAVNISEDILVQIGNEGDEPNVVPSVVTTEELNSITGITDVNPVNEMEYQEYIDAHPELFSAPATVAEVQDMIDEVNGSESVLVQIGNEADEPNTVPSVVTVDQLNTITGIIGVDPMNETLYQQYIDSNPEAFSAPATLEEVQAMITEVNEIAEIVANSNDPADGNPSESELTAVGVTEVNPEHVDEYEEAIANADPAPNSLEELQIIIDAVNEIQNESVMALEEVLEDSNSPDGTENANDTPVSIEQLNDIIGLTDVDPANEEGYQEAIANETGFSNPPTLEQVQEIIDRVNFNNSDADGDGLTNIEEDTNGNGDLTDDDCDADGTPDFMDSDSCGEVGSISTISIAQAFTPNGDGINDTWIIEGIENYASSIIKVYSRSGREVFAKDAYQNDWNGQYRDNSKRLPAGSYYYLINLGDGSKPMDGWIFINY